MEQTELDFTFNDNVNTCIINKLCYISKNTLIDYFCNETSSMIPTDLNSPFYGLTINQDFLNTLYYNIPNYLNDKLSTVNTTMDFSTTYGSINEFPLFSKSD